MADAEVSTDTNSNMYQSDNLFGVKCFPRHF